MPLDDLLARNTKEWLARALDDLELAENAAAQASPAFVRDALFHCQQAVEKMLKGFLTWRDIPFPKIHDLEDIGRRCVESDPDLGALVDRVAVLSQYAWRFRYPGDPFEPSAEEARLALDLAREALDAILTRLPGELKAGG